MSVQTVAFRNGYKAVCVLLPKWKFSRVVVCPYED